MTHLESLTEKLHALLPELLFEIARNVYASHPITLNEIIEVLPEEYGYSKTKGFVKFHKEPRQHYTRMAIYWAKGLPLHKQSPELHEFLDDLLPEPNEE